MSSTQNEWDTNTSNPCIQAQDASPPAHQQASLKDGQSAVTLQFKSEQQRSKSIKAILITITITLTIGTIVWVLNIIGAINGPWSNVCTALSTLVGTIITLLQIYFQFTAAPTSPTMTGHLPPLYVQQPEPLSGHFLVPQPSGQDGALVVYTKRSLRGSNVELYRGYKILANPYAAQNIVERKTGQQMYYIAVFQSLPPGRYTAHIQERKSKAKIMIYSEQVTEIDWR